MNETGEMKKALLILLRYYLINGAKPKKVKFLAEEALEKDIDIDIKTLVDTAMSAMDEVGRRFSSDGPDQIYLPGLLASARAMKALSEILLPQLAGKGLQARGKIVIGTVRGDLHDIGKNIVKMVLEGEGFEVIDLGIDVGKKRFANAIEKHQPQILGLSALLTETMINMEDVIAYLDEKGLRYGVKVMIGGAPVTQEFADEIGADAYADNAFSGAKKVKEMLGIK